MEKNSKRMLSLVMSAMALSSVCALGVSAGGTGYSLTTSGPSTASSVPHIELVGGRRCLVVEGCRFELCRECGAEKLGDRVCLYDGNEVMLLEGNLKEGRIVEMEGQRYFVVTTRKGTCAVRLPSEKGVGIATLATREKYFIVGDNFAELNRQEEQEVEVGGNRYVVNLALNKCTPPPAGSAEANDADSITVSTWEADPVSSRSSKINNVPVASYEYRLLV